MSDDITELTEESLKATEETALKYAAIFRKEQSPARAAYYLRVANFYRLARLGLAAESVGVVTLSDAANGIFLKDDECRRLNTLSTHEAWEPHLLKDETK